MKRWWIFSTAAVVALAACTSGGGGGSPSAVPGASDTSGRAVAVHLPQPSPTPTAALSVLGAPRSGDMVLLNWNNGLALTAVSPKGSVRYLLNDFPSNEVDLAPDGIQLAFMKVIPPSGVGATDAGIYVVDLSTGSQRFLSPCPATCLGGLDWSPDGTRVVFSDTDGHLYLIYADGTHLNKLPAGPFASGPSWSPDGTRIAFLQGNSVSTVQADGSDQVQLASCTGDCRRPTVAWSPDGAWIAYADRNGISVVSPDGSRRARLSRSGIPRGVGFALAWSPDSREIAYGKTMLTYGAFVVDVDSGKVTKVNWPCPCRGNWDPGSLNDLYWIGWVP